MAEWSVMDRDWPYNQFDPYQFPCNQYLPENPEEVLPCIPPALPPPALPPPPPPPPPAAQEFYPQRPTALAAMMYQDPSTSRGLQYGTPQQPPPARGDNPREIRNKAEKQRRDKLNQSIGELASMVPPVVAASRKIDKTGVLRLTAHYLRAHQYVFGDSIAERDQQFSAMSTRALLSLLNGFLLTTTYRGLIVVVSQNVQQFLGYSELDLLGQNVFTIIHEDDRQLLRDQLMPKRHMLGPNGELLVPDEPEGKQQLAETLAGEKRRFIIRFKKLGQRSEPCQYVTCHVEGSLRKSDRACRGYNRCCQMVRRARARGDNPCSSGNDVVFVGMVRLATDTFITESSMESYRMEYRTRHSVDGQIIQTEQRISLVTGYMTHEVNGINAMNFMHRDDVRWVVIALREMYDQHRLVGESCYRLMAKNGQFIYLKTRGRLEVDSNTRAVTSFVCTNTVVDEHEGKHLIKLMKKKFMLMVNNNEESLQEIEEIKEVNEQNLAVEDPRQLEKVILHLVTNLPSPQSEEDQGESPDRSVQPAARLAIIPPRKERIVSAIEKIYSVIKTFPQETSSTLKSIQEEISTEEMAYKRQAAGCSPQLPNEVGLMPLYKETDQPMHKLPNFNEVYQRRHTETSMTIHELNPFTAANTSIRPSTRAMSTITRPTSEIPSPQYTELTTIKPHSIGLLGTNTLPSPSEKPLKYHLYLKPVSASAVELGNVGMAMPIPGGSSVTIGTKRTREYVDLDVVSKKKPSETIVTPSPLPPPQEKPQPVQKNETYNLIDDSLLSLPQIENAMNSLEKSMDPTFPELLISLEVEEILHQIEENSPNNNAPR